MKLVADLNNIMVNLNTLAASVEEFTGEVSSFNGASIECTLEEVSGLLESYKSQISDDLNKLNTSSEEYKTLVDECCAEYEANEENTKVIDASAILEIITNNQDVTIDYEGSAKEKLTGLPSIELYSTIYYDPNLTYNEGGLPIPYFNQCDYGYVGLGSSNIASSGCGFTSCAMVASYLTRTAITPEDMATWSQGYYVAGAGMAWSLPAATAEHYGLGNVTQTSSINEVYEALQDGKAVMSSQRAGLFTSGGHLIVLRGLDDDGNILVNDPNGNNAYGKGYNERAFSKGEIDQSAAQYWIFEGDGENVKAK